MTTTRRPKAPKLWRKAVGGHGHTVTAYERTPGGPLYLRWWNHTARAWDKRSLRHHDREEAEREAKALAGSILAASDAERLGEVTVAHLFERFDREKARHGTATQWQEDRRRMRLWAAFLSPNRQIRSLDRALLDQFTRARRDGRIAVPGLSLSPKPSERTIGADLEFLRRVFLWAMTVSRGDGTPLLERNPLMGYAIPVTANPRRPVASYERYEALREVAGEVDQQGLYPYFLDLQEGMGWRVSALCQIRASDLDLRATETAPFGRILKREESDKMGVEMWAPLAEGVRRAIDGLLTLRPVIGDTPLFSAVRDPAKAWTRYYASSLMKRAEKAAGIAHMGHHAFRRKWASERKHLPLVDVAAAGGWKGTVTLTRCYVQPDEATMYAVMSEPRKVRVGGHS